MRNESMRRERAPGRGPGGDRGARAFATALGAGALLALAGCGDREPPDSVGDAAAPPSAGAGNDADRQTAFRVRADFDAGLNADDGWAAGVDEPAPVTADHPFRLRFEVVAGDDPGPRRYRLQVRRNGGDWRPLAAEDFPYPLKEHALRPAAGRGDPVERTWRLADDTGAQVRWIEDDGPGFWRFAAGERPLLALARYAIGWQPSEFSVELRLGEDAQSGAGIVFEHRDGVDHTRVERFGPNVVRVVRVADGNATILAKSDTDRGAGGWHELVVAVGDGSLTVELGGRTLVEDLRLPMHDLSPRLGVYVAENGSAEFRSFVIETDARTPRTSIIRTAGFEHGAPTRDLLPGSDRPFTGGAGVSFAERTPAWRPDGGHGEWAFPIVIRRFADEAALNKPGDRFDYRLVAAGGAPLPAGTFASVRLEVPDGHVGGTFVETPMRVGPWQAGTGDLYFIMEPSETWNRLMMVKSTDGGRTWREVDGAHRPATGDLEGLGSVLVDGRIHVLHQVSNAVLYHAFDTADGADRPDRWVVRDERVAAPTQPPTQVADLAVRSDGSVVAVYGSADGIRIATRSPDGDWTEAHRIDGPGDAVPSGPTLLVDADDTAHLAYTAGGRARYRSMTPDGALSDAFALADDLADGGEDVGAILPLLDLPADGSVAVVYRAGDGRLYERRLAPGAGWSDPVAVSERRVVQNAVDSDQAGADAVAYGDTIHVLFIEAGTGRLFHASGRDGEWSDAAAVVTDANVQWVRGTILQSADGKASYGFVYDAGSNGGSGMNRFARVPLPGR